MKKKFFLLGILLAALSVEAQLTSLNLGSSVPDIGLGKVLHKPGQELKFSAFEDKLLILDFWGVECRSCIAAMPEIDSLQKQFASKIQFIFVTRDSEKQVDALFSKIKIKKPDVPFIVSDKNLEKLFPHWGVPFHVWIAPKGKLYAETDGFNTNVHTLTSFFEGKQPNLPRRNDGAFDHNYPLVSEQNGALLGFADAYSIWLKGGANNVYGNGFKVQKDSVTHRINFLQLQNADLFMLYNTAFMKDLFPVSINYLDIPRYNRTVLEVADSTAFFPPKEEDQIQDWMDKHVYCYELKLPHPSAITVYQKMKQDLALEFPYEAVIEKRNVKCLVFSDLSPEDQKKAMAKDTTIPQRIIYHKGKGVTLQNLPINSFIETLIISNGFKETPLISETNFKGNLQINLNSKLIDAVELNKELNKFGFKITQEKRWIDMLVIRDKTIAAL